MRVFFIRHPETCLPQGSKAHLSVEGLERARSIAGILAPENIVSILSSPALRALQSVVPLSRALGLPTVVDERIKDRELSGTSSEDYYQMVTAFFSNSTSAVRHGETLDEVTRRLRSFCTDLIDEHLSRSVAVSTHGICISLILANFSPDLALGIWKSMRTGEVYVVPDYSYPWASEYACLD